MNKWFILLLIVCSLSLTTSCSISDVNHQEKPSNSLNSQKNSITLDSNSVQSNDFVLRMISTKDEYIVGEKVELYAALEYVGQQAEITITHAASPIGISLHENNSNIGFGYVMDQPLISTILKQGSAFQQEYKFSGISFDGSNKEYKELYNQLADGHFPEGEYVMTAKANFTDITSDLREDYEMQVSTSFRVVQ
ncbi:hypothetical protein [Paenibacillus endoradicis]|uniref:hypothetical protein n=1 Tax=Paenibacillus endoradicis TaxID=2972487 RepID=UPI002158FCC9|nr:hypothetical protein [Paenibacillus endoradicis]MCR8659359.1 hypothetical protein [Paenibacillus endoradicis]